MIRVRIHINITQVIGIHAVREKHWTGKNEYHRYNLYITDTEGNHDNHEWIGEMRHKYSDGGAKLSAKMSYMYDKYCRRQWKEDIGSHSKNQARIVQ